MLLRTELKTIIDVAVATTMALIDERKISAVQSCTDENRLSPMGTAVLTAVETAVAESTQSRYGVQNGHGRNSSAGRASVVKVDVLR